MVTLGFHSQTKKKKEKLVQHDKQYHMKVDREALFKHG